MANVNNLIPYKKGECGNRNGRPKKWVTSLKKEGYTISQINDSIQVLLSMTMEELKDVYTNPNATVLEKTIANAMQKSLSKGSLHSIDTLMNRVFGKPKETSHVEIDNRIEVIFTKGKTIL